MRRRDGGVRKNGLKRRRGREINDGEGKMKERGRRKDGGGLWKERGRKEDGGGGRKEQEEDAFWGLCVFL